MQARKGDRKYLERTRGRIKWNGRRSVYVSEQVRTVFFTTIGDQNVTSGFGRQIAKVNVDEWSWKLWCYASRGEKCIDQIRAFEGYSFQPTSVVWFRWTNGDDLRLKTIEGERRVNNVNKWVKVGFWNGGVLGRDSFLTHVFLFLPISKVFN